MPRKKEKTTKVRRTPMRWMGGASGSQAPQRPPSPPPPIEKPLPWYVTTTQAKTEEEKTLHSKIMTEWNSAGWVKRLMQVAHDLGTPVFDPIVIEHTPTGALTMRWEMNRKALDVIFLEKDCIGTISLLTDYGETLATMEDGWSQGNINTEQEIAKVWKWLTDTTHDEKFLRELLAIHLHGA